MLSDRTAEHHSGKRGSPNEESVLHSGCRGARDWQAASEPQSFRGRPVIDKRWIGHCLPASVLHIDRTRLQFFAKATGEERPLYTDESAARAAGYPDVPAPPTFLFAADLDSGAHDRMLEDLEVPAFRILHGEQSFTYHKPVFAGDTVTVRSVITDIYQKKDGALEFIVKTSRAVNQNDELVAELRMVLISRR
jgi:acyl dehydratase